MCSTAVQGPVPTSASCSANSVRFGWLLLAAMPIQYPICLNRLEARRAIYQASRCDALSGLRPAAARRAFASSSELRGGRMLRHATYPSGRTSTTPPGSTP